MIYAACFLAGVITGFGVIFFILAYVPSMLDKIFNDSPEGK